MREPNANTPTSDSCPTPQPTAPSVVSICADLESRLRAGESIRCEFYLSQYPWLAKDLESAVDLIFTEYDVRCELGEVPDASEYFDRFPQCRKELNQQFELAKLFDEQADATSSTFSNTSSLSRSKSRFQITTFLAQGGIGQVMRALDTELNREVAVKEIQPRLAASEDIRERFLREAEITGRLEHPGVVPVYGLGKDDEGRPFYAMRLVRGQSFLEAIEAYHSTQNARKGFRSLDFQKLLRRFLIVCDTVAYAHSRGVIHRDIKPQNILLGPFGETLLVDWGLAKVSPTGDQETSLKNSEAQLDPIQVIPKLDQSNSMADWSVELTQSLGSLIGTPAFMSPEQASGDTSSIGPLCDVYSLGATLYALLTDRSRFGDSDVPDTIQKIMSGRFQRPRELNRSIPVPLEAICLKAMALSPKDRYPSAIALAEDIEHYLADERVGVAPESIAGLLTRWGRRNRKLAIGGLVSLLVVTCVSLVAAIRIHGERLRADRESVEARKVTARLAFDRGYQLIEQNQFGEGLLWLQRSLHLTPSSDTAMRRVILSNFSAAKNHLLHRQATYSHDRSISLTVFSSDGKYLLTAEGVGLARVWDVEQATILQELELKKQVRILAAKFHGEGDLVLATASGGKLNLHQYAISPPSDDGSNTIPSSKPFWSDQRTSPTINLLGAISQSVLSHDAQFIACADRESSIVHVYKISDGQLLGEIETRSKIQQMAFQPDTNRLGIVGAKGNARIWELEKSSSKYVVYKSFEKMVRIEFTPDGKLLIAGIDLGSVAVWEIASKQLLIDFGRHTGRITAVACSSDGTTIAGVWDNGIARAWDLQDRRPVCEWLRFDRHTQNLCFRPETSQMLVMAKRHSAILWNLPDPDANSLALRQTTVDAVDISPDGNLAVIASRNGNARLRDPNNGNAVGKPMVHTGAIKRVGFRPDGAVIVTAGLDGIARLWNAQNGSPRGHSMEHRTSSNLPASVDSIAFSFDSQWLATGDNSGYVRIWNADTGELIRTFPKVNASALSLCFGPHSDRVLVGYSSPDNGVRMWHAESSELLWMSKHRAHVRSVALSSNGELAISGGNDETAQLWNSKNGEPRGNELPHRGEVFVVRFSPDSRLAVTGGYDATVRLWSTSSGLPFGEPMHHDALVLDAAFSSDGKRLITGSVDKTARLWDVVTCLPLSSPLTHNEPVAAVKFSPTQNIAVAGRFWRLPSPMTDQPELIERWVRLATQRYLDSGNNVQWLEPTTVADEASEFERLTHLTWSEWSQ